jgi:hypothetical protein
MTCPRRPYRQPSSSGAIPHKISEDDTQTRGQVRRTIFIEMVKENASQLHGHYITYLLVA